MKVERSALRSVQNNVLATSEFSISLDINYEVVQRVTGIVLMRGRVLGRSSFFDNNDLQMTERQAIPLAAQDAANQLTIKISEGW